MIKRIILIFLLLPTFALAQDKTPYTLLAPLPLGNPEGPVSTTVYAQTYIEGAFKLMIALAGVAAIVMIIIGGVQYMMSEAAGSKGDAKKRITNAIGGFVLVIASWLIIYTVNPSIKDGFNINIERLEGTDLSPDLGDVGIPDPEDAENIRTGEGCPHCTPIVYATSIEPGGPVVAINGENLLPPQMKYGHEGGANNFLSVGSGGVPFPSKRPGEGCKISDARACFVDSALVPRLTAMANDLNEEILRPIHWRVTEMIPSTGSHNSDCHKSNNVRTGQCVDAAIVQKFHQAPNSFLDRSLANCIDRNTLHTFLKAIEENVGPNFQYEVFENDRNCYDYYTQNITGNRLYEFESKIKCNATRKICPGTGGQHAHINYFVNRNPNPERGLQP